MRSKPSSRAAVMATDTTRSLNECVGLAESSLIQTGAVKPSSSASRSARISGVMPVPESTRVAGSWPDRQQPGVAPERVRAGLDVGAGDAGERGGVVADLERAEALEAGVLGAERVGRRRSCDRRGRRRATARWAVSNSSHGNEAFLLIFPDANRARAGVGTCVRRPRRRRATESCIARGCRGFVGPVPLPLWMSGAIRLCRPSSHSGRRGSARRVVRREHDHDRAGGQLGELRLHPLDRRELRLQRLGRRLRAGDVRVVVGARSRGCRSVQVAVAGDRPAAGLEARRAAWRPGPASSCCSGRRAGRPWRRRAGGATTATCAAGRRRLDGSPATPTCVVALPRAVDGAERWSSTVPAWPSRG